MVIVVTEKFGVRNFLACYVIVNVGASSHDLLIHRVYYTDINMTANESKHSCDKMVYPLFQPNLRVSIIPSHILGPPLN